ncbi:type II toxin-antitoxin system RelE/ParE family toxin [Pelotomaculum terephthalicicum JT]|uniref:type II toxin-antitoxin system RelE/ParE family toxin n=1 Tax=Pelotomaculum TaxID=191373 RepID=UPI0009D0AE73|nr:MULTISPECIES: type II toxin-antitoxin system RelE/ParE family toxin [Pelotomaculum]MCG9969534.1 type II toxin-antitoxin system RelE/ParE family toxin [Pelotomaculum terephthalicicum JT]OPX86119.1 MAG: Plasmid stabilization system protein [Pelotomaculum sp. PtaB.Bin117]OPY59617.1 MAG: Plasmid stabilization system protein [Pelotomaculum sp. PtaU1.Bin065]
MGQKKYEVIISDAALNMLDSHIDFLARVNVNAARRTMDEILDNIESLQFNPERFPSYENRFLTDSHYRKMLSAKRYFIIYEISGNNVFVDYIVDCRQDYDWLIIS